MERVGTEDAGIIIIFIGFMITPVPISLHWGGIVTLQTAHIIWFAGFILMIVGAVIDSQLPSSSDDEGAAE